MLEGLLHLFAARPWRDIAIDVLDLLIVTVVIYRALIVLTQPQRPRRRSAV